MIQLIKGDCCKELYNVKGVDLLLTDPPYNVSRPNNFTTMGSACRQGMDFGEWDKGADLTTWISKASKCLKENANVVIFNAWENLAEIKKVCEEQYIYISNAVLYYLRAIQHLLTETECLLMM